MYIEREELEKIYDELLAAYEIGSHGGMKKGLEVMEAMLSPKLTPTLESLKQILTKEGEMPSEKDLMEIGETEVEYLQGFYGKLEPWMEYNSSLYAAVMDYLH